MPSSRKPTTPPPTETPAKISGTTIDLGRMVSTLESSFTDTDAPRARMLARFSQIHTAHANVLAREKADLAASPSASADDKAAIDAALETAKDTAHALATAAAVTATPAPTPAAGETVVHGVVEGGSKGIKVTLADDQGSTIASTTTAADGRFILHHKGGLPHRVEVHVHDPRHPAPISVDVREQPLHFVVARLRG